MQIKNVFQWAPAVCVVFWATDLMAQPQPKSAANKRQDANQEIPEGFERQPLEFGGEILKPVGWKFESAAQGKTQAYKMWKPLPDNQEGFDAVATINIVTNTEDSGKTPSKFAESHLKKLAKQGKVIQSTEPTSSNGMIQSGLIIDQKHNIAGVEKEYRTRYFLFADDEKGMLYVLEFGALVSKWETFEPTFRVMTQHLKLIDLSKEKSDGRSDHPDKD